MKNKTADYLDGFVEGYNEGFDYAHDGDDPDCPPPDGYAAPARDLRSAAQAYPRSAREGTRPSTACASGSDREPDQAQGHPASGPSVSPAGVDQAQADIDTLIMQAGMLMAYRAAAEELVEIGEFVAAEAVNARARNLVRSSSCAG